MADFRDFFDNHPSVVAMDAKDGGLFGAVADFAQRSTPEQLQKVVGEVQKTDRDNKRRRRGGSS